jgi:hypothetical protein
MYLIDLLIEDTNSVNDKPKPEKIQVYKERSLSAEENAAIADQQVE